MAMTTDVEMTPERFTALVETYGGDIGRWPAAMQAAARARVAGDLPSARRIAEAQAFDRLLGLAPKTAASPDLVEKILAAATRQPQDSQPRQQAGIASDSNVITLPRGQPRLTANAGTPPRHVGSWRLGRGGVAGAGGMLAASLMIGIWLGASGTAAPTFATAFQGRQGISDLDAMSEIVQSALSLELLEGTEEDLL